MPDLPPPDSFRFRFVPRYRATLLGVGFIVLVAEALDWHNRGAPIWVSDLSALTRPTTLVSGLFLLGVLGYFGRLWLQRLRDEAQHLGEVVLTEEGLCWRSGDGNAFVDVAWDALERMEVDPRRQVITLVPLAGSPLLVGALTGLGTPSLHTRLRGFPELVEVIARVLPMATNEGPSRRLSLALGAAFLLLGATALGLNVAVASWLELAELSLFVPILLGGLGLFLLVRTDQTQVLTSDAPAAPAMPVAKRVGVLLFMLALSVAVQILINLDHRVPTRRPSAAADAVGD